MKFRKMLQNCTATTLLLCSSLAFASIQDLGSIEQVVVDYIEKQHPADATLNVQLQRLDKRLKLADCNKDLVVDWSPGSRSIGRTNVSVACESPKPWRIHVRANVEKESLTWVLTASVNKGDVLSRQLVSQQSVRLGQQGALGLQYGTPISDIEPWLGQVFVQAMRSGGVLGDKALALPELVKKGDPVSIVYQSAQFAIRAKGVALESGVLQQKIGVKNSFSNKVVDAVVTGRTTVAITR